MRRPWSATASYGKSVGGEGFALRDESGHTREARVELQKKTLAATERDEEKRSAFRQRLRGVDPERLIFVDESSTNVALTPRYAPLGAQRRKGPREGAKELGQERHADLVHHSGGCGTIREHRGIFRHGVFRALHEKRLGSAPSAWSDRAYGQPLRAHERVGEGPHRGEGM